MSHILAGGLQLPQPHHMEMARNHMGMRSPGEGTWASKA